MKLGVSDYERMYRIFNEECRRTLGDAAAWVAETRRPPLPFALVWPLPKYSVIPKKGPAPRNYLAYELTEAAVEMVLGALLEGHGIQLSADPRDPDLQTVLRMAWSVSDRTIARCGKEIGEGFVLVGKRELRKRVAEDRAAAALSTDTNKRAAFEAAGISKSAAYRALKRPNNPK